jgi:esterase/lipase/1-acyl-sn-glycerol-3-phosphate acyltransferase
MNGSTDLTISETTYRWCVRAFSFLHKRLGINIKLHDNTNLMEDGQIFLFNHFARFETVIPQYLIFEETGVYCRSVAASEFFKGNETVAKFLGSIGAVPNDLEGVLPFLAAEVLRGRKIIVFPEGGIVKDRRVIDDSGGFSIFSATARKSRKHHKGAAAIALTLEIFKKRILSVHQAGEMARLDRWRTALGLESIGAMLAAARKPTLIIPSNITFFPIRITDNILTKGAELFSGNLTDKFKEELLIEGNILLKRTDMDIRFGDALRPGIAWRWWERKLLDRCFERIDSLEALFNLKHDADRWMERMVSVVMSREIRRIRDASMGEMYSRVTINLSHLASGLILAMVENGADEVDRDYFHRALYLAIKGAQQEPALHLHRGLTNPEAYDGIHTGLCRGFQQFLNLGTSSALMKVTDEKYGFEQKLREEHEFHEIRLENMIEVYANEMAPVAGAGRTVTQALKAVDSLDGPMLARHLFDDELRAFEWCRQKYSQPQHGEINQAETAVEDAAPFLLVPEKHGPMGIVLVHGFLASPAELSAFGHTLAARGFPVVGVRLRGHGTSPWDLRDRSWQEWLGSVRRGFEIMSGFVDRVCLVGFSTGGLLSLRLAAEHPAGLAGVAAVSAPIKFHNKNLIFVPVIHGANVLTRWVSSLEGVKPFVSNDPENPRVNYRNIPVHGLFELQRAVADTADHLAEVMCPVSVIQGADDNVVNAESAGIIMEKLGSSRKKIHMIPTERHGILGEAVHGAQDIVISFLDSISGPDQADSDRAAAGNSPQVKSYASLAGE